MVLITTSFDNTEEKMSMKRSRDDGSKEHGGKGKAWNPASQKKAQQSPSAAALAHGSSRKAAKPWSDKDKNPDGLPLTEEERAEQQSRQKRVNVYIRGERGAAGRGKVQRAELRTKLGRLEDRIAEAAEINVGREEFLLSGEAGFMEAENGTLERTGKVTQAEVARNVAASAALNAFSLDLPELGPYGCAWTRNGRHLLLAGAKGHLAVMDAQKKSLITELHVRETVRAACFLHNESLFAVAQKKHLYLYDRDGVELHCLRTHVEPTALSFLPYHFLLAVASNTGYLKYTDTSTGSLVSEHRTKLGSSNVMAQNPHNGVIGLGHHNGTVTLWSPASPQSLVKMLCHRGPVGALCVDPGGTYMASAGMEGAVKVWDLRMYKELHSYLTPRPATSLAVSQRGLLAVGCGSHVQVWRDGLSRKAKAPYLRHEVPGKCVASGGLGGVSWRPFEDVLGLGHSGGFGSLVVPGAGEPNYDSLEANPFESKKERREAEVHQLLDKLGPETIALDRDFVGTVDVDPDALRREQAELAAAVEGEGREAREKNRMRGRSKIGKKLKRKKKNIIDEARVALQQRLEKERAAKKEARDAAKKASRKARGLDESATGDASPAPAAIGRFFKSPGGV